jgi:hypothetical protein
VTRYLRIGGALTLGVIIVLSAFFVVHRKSNSTAQLGGTLEVSPTRSYIEPTDANGDGVPDWEEGFNERIFETIETPTSTVVTDSGYEAPTTFTGKFAEAFFKDYLDSKVQGADLSDPTELVNNAVGAIEANTKPKTYSPIDIDIIADSPESLRAYGNAISAVIQRYSLNNTNEAVILDRALKENNPQLLTELESVKTAYGNFISNTLLIPAPESLAEDHLRLLNAYEAIYTDIGAMQVAFTDPLFSLARIREYQGDATRLGEALFTIGKELRAQGIIYAKDEPGAFFYIFKL